MELYSLIDRLLDGNKWPTYTNSRVLSELSRHATEAFNRDTFDGYLSYVLISHQECEDYALLLLRHIQFTLRLHVVPSGFGWPSAKYEQPGVRENQMFGRILQLIENSLEFEYKDEFIAACRAQNQIRNRLAHKLIEGITLADIRALAHEYKTGIATVIDCFNSADEHFSYFYCEQIVDKRWNELLAHQIKAETDANERNKWKVLLERLENEQASSFITKRAEEAQRNKHTS